MRRWRVWIPYWEIEVDADDEGYALMEADSLFNFISRVRSEEIDPEEEEDNG